MVGVIEMKLFYIFVALISSLTAKHTTRHCLRSRDNAIELSWNTAGKRLLSGYLGLSLPQAVGHASLCPETNASMCFRYGDYARLEIFESDHCSRLEWTSTFAKRLEDCFDLIPGHHWYGGGETLFQEWPIENETRPESPFVTGDALAGDEYSSVTENYWLISTGISVRVDEETPLFTSWNSVHENQVCFVAKAEAPYQEREQLRLSYHICSGENVKEAHLRSLRTGVIPKPTGIPSEEMFLKPFWSTWAEYKTEVNQSIVIDFAKKILSEGFSRSSHVEIDDNWETCYGEAKFNAHKFPNPREMVEELKKMNLRTTLWIHPFINMNCPSLLPAVEAGYFVKGSKGRPGITKWWQGDNAALIDYTNAAATAWWEERLRTLQNETGIDSFKFDAGETNWLPVSAKLSADVNLQPNIYTTKYVEAMAKFGPMIEVRSGRRNQNLPIFTRMLDKDSRWSYKNGLRSLIPTLLLFSIVGYPFVLPDMIGGNSYNEEKPSAELFVRWMQANAFMPAVQFSIVPWRYNQTVVDITLGVLALRQSYESVILEGARKAVQDGSPINRPMWWVDPEDPQTFTIDSQYMVGDSILVAPVLEEGATTRDIYLPKGTWTAHDAKAYEGPRWLRQYPAPLDTLPFFLQGRQELLHKNQSSQSASS